MWIYKLAMDKFRRFGNRRKTVPLKTDQPQAFTDKGSDTPAANGGTSIPQREYVSTVLHDQSYAIQGDVYGNLVNISIGIDERHPSRIVRSHQVFETHTIETVSSFIDGGSFQQRGAMSSIEKRWDRKEDLGAGLFGEVHREEYCDPQGRRSSRAVKVMRRRQLDRLQVDFKRELDALIRLSKASMRKFSHYVCTDA